MAYTPPTNTGPKTDDDWNRLYGEAQELFSPAAPINEAELFAGRVDQVAKLIDAVLERGRHAALYGERGVGKTSLANTFHMLMGRSAPNAFHAIRKQGLPNDTYSSLWRRVFAEIEVTDDAGKKYRLGDAYPDEVTPDDVIRELGVQARTRPLIVIFDEFDRVIDQDAKRLLSHTIKAISDTGVNGTIIVVGVAEDINLLIEEHQSIERNLSEIEMPRMSAQELNEILDKRYPKLGMKIEADARWKIVTLSRGLPSYVHFLGRDAAKSAISRRRLLINEADVDNAIKSMIATSTQSEEKAYDKAVFSNKKNNLYKKVLLACAMAPTDDLGRFAPSDVIEPLEKLTGKKVQQANFHNHLAAFVSEERGAILEKKAGAKANRYRFREPKMQPYVVMKGIADGEIGKDALSILSAPEQPRLSNEF